MAELTDEEYDAAVERGRIEFVTKPHARTARYDRDTGMMVLELYNGCTFAVPARYLQGLEHASDEQLGKFELSGYGYGLHWEALDADISVPGLLEGIFGTARHMAPFRARLRKAVEELEERRDEAA